MSSVFSEWWGFSEFAFIAWDVSRETIQGYSLSELSDLGFEIVGELYVNKLDLFCQEGSNSCA